MNIYLDVCCLNRPFDDQSQDRIYIESEAILSILSRCQSGGWILAGSDIIELELSKIMNMDKLSKVRSLYSLHGPRLTVNALIKKRAEEFQNLGLRFFDSLHLAVAEFYNQNVLLTSDDEFIKIAAKCKAAVSVENPVIWLMEETQNEHCRH